MPTGAGAEKGAARALEVYRDKSALNKMISQAMATDFSFSGPAREYAAIYDSLIS